MKKKIAIFPGTFDPFTKGHQDIVNRSIALFDKIIIAIGYNSAKSQRYFDIDLIVEKIEKTFEGNDKVEVHLYNELTATFAKKVAATFLIRGLRNTTDFEYENTISQINLDQNPKLETVFLITSPEFAYINSSIVRELHKYNASIDKYIPYKL